MQPLGFSDHGVLLWVQWRLQPIIARDFVFIIHWDTAHIAKEDPNLANLHKLTIRGRWRWQRTGGVSPLGFIARILQMGGFRGFFCC